MKLSENNQKAVQLRKRIIVVSHQQPVLDLNLIVRVIF